MAPNGLVGSAGGSVAEPAIAGPSEATAAPATVEWRKSRRDIISGAISGLAGSPASLAFKQTELAEAVQQVLNELKEDGFYDELFDQWGVAKIDNWENWNGQFEIY